MARNKPRNPMHSLDHKTLAMIVGWRFKDHSSQTASIHHIKHIEFVLTCIWPSMCGKNCNDIFIKKCAKNMYFSNSHQTMKELSAKAEIWWLSSFNWCKFQKMFQLIAGSRWAGSFWPFSGRNQLWAYAISEWMHWWAYNCLWIKTCTHR